MLTIRNYVKAADLEEAWQLNQKKRNVILGGMLWLRMCNRSIDTAIDLSALGLDKIEESETEFSIGCMCTLRDLELHEGLYAYSGAVRAAVKDIVGVQMRNLATVGGSLYGRYGFSDPLTAFLGLESEVELYKGGRIPLKEYLHMPYDNDILVRVIVKKQDLQCAFECVRNARTDFSVLNVAVTRAGGRHFAVVGARPMKAFLVEDEQNLLAEPTDENKRAFAEYVAETVPTGSNLRGSAAYRRHLARVLTLRALDRIGGQD